MLQDCENQTDVTIICIYSPVLLLAEHVALHVMIMYDLLCCPACAIHADKIIIMFQYSCGVQNVNCVHKVVIKTFIFLAFAFFNSLTH